MPSENSAARISESLARGERFEDFAYLFDTLVRLRRPYNDDLKLSEEVSGWIMCFLLPDPAGKPLRYVQAMQEFRLRFAHISTDPRLRAEFSNCVRNAALTLREPEDIIWTPSLYFSNPWRVSGDLQDWF